MLHPIHYVGRIYCGPDPIDVETAVDTYEDKLAGRRRRLDMSITTLSVATLRDVDDSVRNLTKATRAWLIDGVRHLEKTSSLSDGIGPTGNVICDTPSLAITDDYDNDDDDDLICMTSDEPTTAIVRRGGAGVGRSGVIESQTFLDLFSKAKVIRGPCLPEWEELLGASADSVFKSFPKITGAAGTHTAITAEEDPNTSLAKIHHRDPCEDIDTDADRRRVSTGHCEKRDVEMSCEELDLSNPLDRQLFERLEVERFDDHGCSKTSTYISGLPTISSSEACPWAKGAMPREVSMPVVVSSTVHDDAEERENRDTVTRGASSAFAALSSPLKVRILFPHLTSLDLSYTRIYSIDLFEGCKTIKYLRIVNNLGIKTIPKGLEGLVVFEADRCFWLEDIHTGLSGLPILATITIDEAFNVKRLPTCLPMLDQLNISRADGLSYEGDLNGETFANPLNFPRLEELFIHGQKTIKRLAPLLKADLGGEGDLRTESVVPATTTFVLPKLQMLVASASMVEDLDLALSGHTSLQKLVMGPLCKRIPANLSALTSLDCVDCVHLTSLSPIVGSITLEELDISNTENLAELVDGAGADEWISDGEDKLNENDEDYDDDDCNGKLQSAAKNFTDGIAAAVEVKESADDVAQLKADAAGVTQEGTTEKKDAANSRLEKSAAAAQINADLSFPGDTNTEEGGIHPNTLNSRQPFASSSHEYPAFPNLTTFIAVGAWITSLRPLRDSAYLEYLDISSTKHIKTIPSGLCSLQTLNANFSNLRSLDSMEGSITLKTLNISYAEKLKTLPILRGIERINNHKANFFLKMYVVSNLQQRGMRMFLRQERDERRKAAMANLDEE